MNSKILQFRGRTTTEYKGKQVENVASAEHRQAIMPHTGRYNGLKKMLEGWEMYSENYKGRFESPIGEDYVLGVYWKDIGQALRALLNGETGGLDCASIDENILECMKENGIDTDNL